MFHCQITNKVSRPGDKLFRIVIEKRVRSYTKFETTIVEGRRKTQEVDAGMGWEIVKEINASADGFALWESWSAEERNAFLNAY